MDERKLTQLQHLKREIQMLNDQIEDMEYTVADGTSIVIDSVRGSSTSYPYTQHKIVITGLDGSQYYKKLNRLKGRLTSRVNELMETVEEINQYIENINDSEMRQIIALRYINGLSWQQVAFHIGEIDESYPRRKCSRFLKAAENAE